MISNGAVRHPSEAMVFEKGTNLQAHVHLQVPALQRRQIVKEGEIHGDKYESITLGLVKLCNVDLGHRIKEGKAKKRTAPKSPAQHRPKVSEEEKRRYTRRLIAQMAAS
jgi:hypothetical protein